MRGRDDSPVSALPLFVVIVVIVVVVVVGGGGDSSSSSGSAAVVHVDSSSLPYRSWGGRQRCHSP